MAVAYALACYDMATITVVKCLEVFFTTFKLLHDLLISPISWCGSEWQWQTL
jgi:hypothetical protein